MARKKTSPVEDLFEIATLLPWWASVGIAVVAYFVCHSFATADIAIATKPSELGQSFVHTIVKTIASFAQYLLPVIFLAGAAFSAMREFGKKSSILRVPGSFNRDRSQSKTGESADHGDPWKAEREADDLYKMWKRSPSDEEPKHKPAPTHWSAELLAALEWKRFEEVCAGLFERLGFETKSATRGADGGIDICLYQPPSNLPVAVVQCKSWSKKVGVNVVRELRGVMAAGGVTKGIFVTSSTYTDDAIAFASANHIDLMDSKAVLAAIRKLAEEQQASLLRLATAGDYTTPTCASCGVKMVLRKPKSGGKQFWGCVNYPKCKMILNVAGA